MKLLATLTLTEKSAAKIGFCYLVAIIVLISVCSFFPILPVQAQNGRLGTVVIFGADQYQFPRNARDFLPDDSGIVHEMSLRLIYPEMEGRTPGNSRSMSLPSQSNRSIQLLLMEDILPGIKVVFTPRQSLNLQVWYGLTRQQYSRDEIEKLEERLSNLILKDFSRAPIYDLDELALKSDIKIEPLDHLRSGMQRGERRFIGNSGKDNEVFIACESPKVSKNPNCNMWFAFRDIYVKANFVLAMLPEWDGIRKKISDYFEKYRVIP